MLGREAYCFVKRVAMKLAETPREEAEATEEKRRINALDGDGEEKEEAV